MTAGRAGADTDAVLRSGFADFQEYVNPLIALRAELLREPVRVCQTRDGLLIDDEGRAIEDFHGTQAFGHRHPHIAAALRAYLDGSAPSWYPSRVNPFAGRLARVLYERTGYDNAFFGMSGSDATEAAMKLARAATGRPRILALRGAYHGTTFGSCALMQPGPFRDPFAPHLPDVESLPFADAAALATALQRGDVAAVIVEPIQLEGGVRPLPAAYVQVLGALTAQHGTLLVADEVQTGMGRTGDLLATAAWPRRPDVVLLAKTLGGGLVPCSAMLTRRALFERAYGRDFASCEAHNSTFSGNATSCVAALAALELLDDALLQRIRALGAACRARLDALRAAQPLVRSVRGDGLIIGIELSPIDHPWLSFEHFGLPQMADQPTIGVLLCHRLYRRGYYCFVCGHDWSTLRLQPRYNIPESTLDAFVDALREELAYVASLL